MTDWTGHMMYEICLNNSWWATNEFGGNYRVKNAKAYYDLYLTHIKLCRL